MTTSTSANWTFFTAHPPKVIWLSIANVRTDAILRAPKNKHPSVEEFNYDSAESLLILKLPQDSA
jgi:predicted nuclease of predicted toxin-antitoxin system